MHYLVNLFDVQTEFRKQEEEEKKKLAVLEEEEAARQAEREEQRQRLQSAFVGGPTNLQRSTASAMSLLLRGTGAPTAVEFEKQEMQVLNEEDTAIFDDDEIDPEEREALKSLQIKRQHEELQRKKQLQAEHERRKLEELEQQMLDFQRINELKRKEEAERSAAMQVHLMIIAVFNLHSLLWLRRKLDLPT